MHPMFWSFAGHVTLQVWKGRYSKHLGLCAGYVTWASHITSESYWVSSWGKWVREWMSWSFVDLRLHSLFIFPNPWVKWSETFKWHPQGTLLCQYLTRWAYPFPHLQLFWWHLILYLSLGPLSWALKLYYFQLEISAWKFHRQPQSHSVNTELIISTSSLLCLIRSS